mmetsp:Transcript_37138/g.46461  ORF Transcript_37138/g.46461 Transcript_37138/m.46461 type:complete len:96 (+) Transcript_37138:277-564(+)
MANLQYDDAIDKEMVANIPNEIRGLRACIPCLLVKTFTQFYEQGCENCEFLALQDDRERCMEITTDQFEGLVGVMDPKNSWVSRWIRVFIFYFIE